MWVRIWGSVKAPPSTASGSGGWGGSYAGSSFNSFWVKRLGRAFAFWRSGSELCRILPYSLPVLGVSCVEVGLGTVVGQTPLPQGPCYNRLSSCLFEFVSSAGGQAGTELVAGAGLGKTSVFPAVRGVKLLI